MNWYPPDNYEPIRGVAAYVLTMNKPAAGSAEAKLLEMMLDNKSAEEVGLSNRMARRLIAKRIVPTGVYPGVLAIALKR